MIVFKCVHCQNMIQAQDENKAKTMACPHCMQPVVVPGQAGAPILEIQKTPPASSLPAPPVRLPGLTRHVERGLVLRQVAGGIIATFVFYGVLGLAAVATGHQFGFAQKFLDRGWTPYAAVFLAFWSMSILSARYLTVRRRRRCLTEDYIPPYSQFRTDEEIDALIRSTQSIAQKLRDNILGPRLRRALEHYRASRNVTEVGDILKEESDNDYAAMVSGYSLVRVFLWTIPILGFIGTVMGVGAAVGGFAQFLAGAQEIDEIKSALTGVTGGLGVAFDTTFVGLLLSVIVMIVMSSIEKLERDQLQIFEDYCIEALLRALPAQAAASTEHAALDRLRIEKEALSELLNKQQDVADDYSQALARAEGTIKEFSALQERLQGELSKAAGGEETSILAEVKDLLASLDPVLHRLAEEPIEVQVQFTTAPVQVKES